MQQKLDAILAWCKTNEDEATGILDDLVQSCKADEAAAINNEGFTGQLSYLSFQFGIEGLEAILHNEEVKS